MTELAALIIVICFWAVLLVLVTAALWFVDWLLTKDGR